VDLRVTFTIAFSEVPEAISVAYLADSSQASAADIHCMQTKHVKGKVNIHLEVATVHWVELKRTEDDLRSIQS